MEDYERCVGDAVTSRRLHVHLIFFKTEYRVEYSLETFLARACLANRSLLPPHPEKLAPLSKSELSTMLSMSPSIFIFRPYFLVYLLLKKKPSSSSTSKLQVEIYEPEFSFGPLALSPMLMLPLMSLRHRGFRQSRILLLSLLAFG